MAAATAGETRCVRPPLPCRPSKLRLLVDAQRSTRLQLVRIHAQAHGAAGGTPFEACAFEDSVQALGLCLRPDTHRARHDHAPALRSPRILPSTTEAARRRSSIRLFVQDPMKNGINRHVPHRHSWHEIHVFHGASAAFRAPRIVDLDGSGTTASMGMTCPGLVPQETWGRDPGSHPARPRDRSRALSSVGSERQSVECLFPELALGRVMRVLRYRQRWCHPARSCLPWHLPRSTCCKSSCGPPSRGTGLPTRDIRRCGRYRRPCRSCR